ncbi:DUF916 domain-containing protein [Enterococcus faecium]|uniref:DUF916 domain-containing protein n=1 Tax=Enterococcus faecium TaxID=1352 RepID=UPI00338D491B
MKKNVFLYLISIFLLLLMGNSNSVYSEEMKSNDSVRFNVKAILPENQLNKENSFFDLRVAPNQKQEIELLITNTSSKEEVYEIAINQAYTNKQGFIDYALKSESEKNQYKFPIEDIVDVPDKVTVLANQSKKVSISLKIPDKPFVGEILSAFQIKKEDNDQNGINNSYGYIIGLRLTQNDQQVKRKLTLEKIEAKEISQQDKLLITFHNPEMESYGSLKYKITLINTKDNKTVYNKEFKDLQISPESLYEMELNLEEVEIPNGIYQVKIEVSDAKNNKWNFEENVDVDKNDQSKQVNLKNEEKDNKFFVLFILGPILLIILLIIICLKLLKKSR